MKVTLLTIVALLAIPFSSCKKHRACKENDPIDCSVIDLSEKYDPVCGCDGVTYQNEGYAQCVGGISQYRKGACN